MFRDTKIAFRLYALVAFMALLLIGIGINGFRVAGEGNASLKTVYEDRAVPLGQIAEMMEANQKLRVEMGGALLNPTKDEIAKRTAAAEVEIRKIADTWKAYTATYLTEEEKKLASKLEELRGTYRNKGVLPLLEALKAGRLDDARAVMSSLSTLYPPVEEGWHALLKLQMDVAKQEYENAQKEYTKERTISSVIIVLGLLSSMAVAWWIIRSFSSTLAHAVSVVNSVAQGDLTTEVTVHGKDETGQLLAAMKNMVENLKKLIGEVKMSAETIASASHELSASSEQMSRGITDQSSRSTQIATTSEQMSQTVVDVARNASSIATSAAETAATAENGGAIVGKSVDEVSAIARSVSESARTIGNLGEKSKQIGEIVGVINDIADQTNLLALNAAIEAARAGEQGRGFAVVADEVRKLAERTAKATSEIADMIRGMQGEVDGAVRSMDEATRQVEVGVRYSAQAGDALQGIVSSVGALQSMVQQIASSTEEMSSASEQVSGDIQAIATSSTEMSSGATQISQSSSDLARLASDLHGIVDRFKIRTNGSSAIVHA